MVIHTLLRTSHFLACLASDRFLVQYSMFDYQCSNRLSDQKSNIINRYSKIVLCSVFPSHFEVPCSVFGVQCSVFETVIG